MSDAENTSTLSMVGDALKRLAGSMKVWTAILGIVSAIAVKKGLEVDQELYWTVVAIFVSLLGAQGAADFKKNAKKVVNGSVLANGELLDFEQSAKDAGYVKLDEAELMKYGYVKAQPELKVAPPQGGFVRLSLLVIIAIIGASIAMVSCSATTKSVASTVLDCTTKQAKSLTDEFGSLYELAIQKATGQGGTLDRDALKATTKNFLVGSGVCVANNVIADILTRKPDTSGPQVGGMSLDKDALKTLIQKGDAKTVKTLHGEF